MTLAACLRVMGGGTAGASVRIANSVGRLAARGTAPGLASTVPSEATSAAVGPARSRARQAPRRRERREVFMGGLVLKKGRSRGGLLSIAYLAGRRFAAPTE